MGKHASLSGRERVARRRKALRAQGLRPKQFWVQDTRSPGFWEEVNRQAALIAGSEHEREDQAFIDSLTDWDSLPPWDAD